MESDYKKLKNKSGIYQIRNLVNDKFYVGSAIDLYNRKKSHFSLLRKNKHHSPKLQRAFNKYSEENFVFEVIEEVRDKSLLLEREQYYLDKFDVVNNGYNICLTVGNMLGFKHSNKTKKLFSAQRSGKNNNNYGKKMSEEQKKILSEVNKKRTGSKNSFFGKHHTEETKDKIRQNNHINHKVICLETKNVYVSTREAERQTGCNHMCISKCCRGLQLTSKGLHWAYYNDYIKSNLTI